jgi:uncharacterized LabA/DUF88 family protein
MPTRRARIFIDYWNFQLGWNAASGKARCDWRRLPAALVDAATLQLRTVGITDAVALEDTLLYASVDPVAERPLRKWLTETIDPLPSWSVTIRDRKPRPKSIHCRECRTVTSSCPACSKPYMAKPEKGVDTAIVTDMLSLAWQDAYDVAILVSSDADFVPAVERVQERGIKVVNAAWPGKGHNLKGACWAAFDLGKLASGICR